MTLVKIFTALWWLWIVCEILLQILTRTWNKSETRDRGSIYVLLPVLFLSISLGMRFGSKHGPTMGGAWILQVAFLLFVAGFLVRLVAIAMLGRSFSVNVAIHATQRLYRRGLYRVVRHPSYTGLLLMLLAIGLTTRHWIGLFLVVVPSTAALLYRIKVEEEALTEAFGAEYTNYARSTRRLLPGIY